MRVPGRISQSIRRCMLHVQASVFSPPVTGKGLGVRKSGVGNSKFKIQNSKFLTSPSPPLPLICRGYAARGAAFLVCLAVGATALAAEPSLRVGLEPQRLGSEDLTRLTVQVVEPGNDRPEPNLGQLVNFEVVQGPSTETHFSWVNGQSTSSLSLSWILRPLGVGSAVVGPITVRLGARELAGGAVTAEIVPGSVHQQRRTRRTGPFGGVDPFAEFFGNSRRPAREAKVEMRHILSRSKVADGRPLVASVVLDTTGGGVDGFEWVDVPKYPGWWVQRLENPEKVEAEVVEVNGESFNRFILARFVLIPLKPGTLQIPAAKARIGFRGQSVFAPHTVVERSTRTVDVVVTPRPAAPPWFSGAVGDLRYSAAITPDVIPFGASAVVTITLEGRGNLPLVQAPALWPACEDCETYPPEEGSAVTIDRSGIRGSRSWSMTLLPGTSGELILEPVTLAVFNPASGAYENQRLGPLTLMVEAPIPTPTPVRHVPAAGVADGHDDGLGDQPEFESGRGDPSDVPIWVIIGSALLIGVFGGGLLAWLVTRRRGGLIPARKAGQTPAERARDLQLSMEQWWVALPEDQKFGAREAEMKAVRKALEAIRFAPGRADHSETARDLEKRLRALVR